MALALIGGALADSFDRRKLIFGAELASGFVSAALLVNALVPSPQLWLLYVAATLVRRGERRAATTLGRALAAARGARGAQGGDRDLVVA